MTAGGGGGGCGAGAEFLAKVFKVFLDRVQQRSVDQIFRLWTSLYPAGRVPAVLCSRDVYPQCKLCRRPLRSRRCCSWVWFLTCPLLCIDECRGFVHRQAHDNLEAVVGFRRSAPFFGLLLTELSSGCLRTFSSPRRPIVVGCRGLRAWRGRRESDSQVFCHMYSSFADVAYQCRCGSKTTTTTTLIQSGEVPF